MCMTHDETNTKLHFVVGFSSPWEKDICFSLENLYLHYISILARCVIALNVQIFEQIAPTHAKA